MKEHYIATFDIAALPRFAVGFDHILEELVRTQEKLSNSNYPPYNIIRLTETKYAFEIAVAGFEEDELDVEMADGELVIKGNANDDNRVVGNYLHQGIARRNFVRTFALADNTEVRGAEVRNGILTITVEVFIPQSKVEKVAISFHK